LRFSYDKFLIFIFSLIIFSQIFSLLLYFFIIFAHFSYFLLLLLLLLFIIIIIYFIIILNVILTSFIDNRRLIVRKTHNLYQKKYRIFYIVPFHLKRYTRYTRYIYHIHLPIFTPFTLHPLSPIIIKLLKKLRFKSRLYIHSFSPQAYRFFSTIYTKNIIGYNILFPFHL
jgi:hypothetical protein